MQICSDHVLNDIIYQRRENGIVYINHLIVGKKLKNEVDIVNDIQMLLGVLRRNCSYHTHEGLLEVLTG